jgi:hypothetical protein
MSLSLSPFQSHLLSLTYIYLINTVAFSASVEMEKTKACFPGESKSRTGWRTRQGIR